MTNIKNVDTVICQRNSSDNNVAVKKCGLFNFLKGAIIAEIHLTEQINYIISQATLNFYRMHLQMMCQEDIHTYNYPSVFTEGFNKYLIYITF